jgi:hypothetical protein
MKAEESTELSVVERAALALGAAEHERQLRDLVVASASITAIANQEGYDQCHAARMRLKTARVNLTAKGKAAREDATAFSKAVIAEEKRLVAIVEPEENRLQAIEKAEDDRKEAIKQAQVEAEIRRVDSIRGRIEDMRLTPQRCIGLSSGAILQTQNALLGLLPDLTEERFAEFTAEARAVWEKARDQLAEMHCAQAEWEAADAANKRQQQAAAEKLAADLAELDRLRAEQEEREAAARAERDAADAKARAEREEADRIAAEERRVEKAKLDAERAEIEAREAALRAEDERKEREQAEADAAARRVEVDRQKAIKAAERPSDEAIVDVLALHFRVHESKVLTWLFDFDHDAASSRLLDEFQ